MNKCLWWMHSQNAMTKETSTKTRRKCHRFSPNIHQWMTQIPYLHSTWSLPSNYFSRASIWTLNFEHTSQIRCKEEKPRFVWIEICNKYNVGIRQKPHESSDRWTVKRRRYQKAFRIESRYQWQIITIFVHNSSPYDIGSIFIHKTNHDGKKKSNKQNKREIISR